jgi:hypothetical protein
MPGRVFDFFTDEKQMLTNSLGKKTHAGLDELVILTSAELDPKSSPAWLESTA